MGRMAWDAWEEEVGAGCPNEEQTKQAIMPHESYRNIFKK